MIGRDKVPPDIARWAEENKTKRTVLKATLGEWDAYLVSLGEKPTAGYEVKITGAAFEGGQLKVTVVVVEPKPGAVLAQVITYPYQVFAVPKGMAVRIMISDQQGKPYPLGDSQLVRPGSSYALFPLPQPETLSLPQGRVLGGTRVELLETRGEWVRVKQGDDEGWLPRWYLVSNEGDTPVKGVSSPYLVINQDTGGLLYPEGPRVVDLFRGRLAKPINAWGDWYQVSLLNYDIPAVMTAWVAKSYLSSPRQVEPAEGFLAKGTEVFEGDDFERIGRSSPTKLSHPLTVMVQREKDGYVYVMAAGGWDGWTRKENLLFNPPNTRLGLPSEKSRLAIAAFLKKYDLKVTGTAELFWVTVPESWKVPLGGYPSGVYWGLANVLSKGAGLDLTKWKGEQVLAWRSELEGGLPGKGPNSQYRYPSNVVLLLREDKVVGAWLEFNSLDIGPSVRKRDLEEIAGKSLEEWLKDEGYFYDDGKNADLADLGPVEVVKAFLGATNAGDKRRANACLSPRFLISALTMNREPASLYNRGFTPSNSIVENIRSGKLLSWKFYDPEEPAQEIKNLGDRQKIGVVAELGDLQWRDEAFNTPSGRGIRFFILAKTYLGWKIEGIGTGP
ncbi:MAG: DUF4830 domain-containing protein [Firmicutes bacterium]|nr:DUF4830 domain-containing protein [Bacillota bacterium]MCL5039668.1 DUF4830 domain-containing protein [Bacillota bacterium]